jgi:hypothetical protein
LTDRELCAWAAGFFDGEGTTCSFYRKDRDKNRISMSLPQVNLLPLKRFQQAVKVGSICLRNKRSERAQECFVWQAQNYKDVRKALDILWEFLSDVKRQQATEALAFFEQNPTSDTIGNPNWVKGYKKNNAN